MPFGSIEKLLSGYTSDHTHQTITAKTYTAKGDDLVLRGMTWNLLNRAHGKNAEHATTNNPFDLDELEADYIKRKQKQLEFLAKQIELHTLDFIVLQEVDVFTRDPLIPAVKLFLDKLRAQGWGLVHSDRTEEVRLPLVILYDTKKLHFLIKRSLFPAQNGKKTALEATFTYGNTSTEVCITNMHLDYETDHRNAIITYQQQQIAAGRFTVIAGDTNHPREREHYSLIGDLDKPTNIARPLGDQQPTDDGGKILKRIDGFMVGPAFPGAHVEITEGAGAYFKWLPASMITRAIRGRKIVDAPLGRYAVLKFDPIKAHATHVVHRSSIGLPWIVERFKHYLVSAGASFPKN